MRFWNAWDLWYPNFPEEKCAFYQGYPSNIYTISTKILEWYIKDMACEDKNVKSE